MDAEALRTGPKGEHVSWQADASGVVIRQWVYNEAGKWIGTAWLGISTHQLAQYEDAIANQIMLEGQDALFD